MIIIVVEKEEGHMSNIKQIEKCSVRSRELFASKPESAAEVQCFLHIQLKVGKKSCIF
jgi:hypothetical protein